MSAGVTTGPGAPACSNIRVQAFACDRGVLLSCESTHCEFSAAPPSGFSGG